MVDEKKFEGAGSLKPGHLVLIDGEVCQVRGVEKSKPGKHGAAKVRVTAFNIFTGQKRGLLKGTDAEVEVPIVPKGDATVVAILGEIIQIMDIITYETYDAPKPAADSEIPVLKSGDGVEYQKYGTAIKIVRKR
ncbi:MAG: translation initiation factor IF-5A [Candidatus Diapherotrites archaeon]|nr:translation initiation factor IF-5A [Candidatus Diapherotrites archaeon]